MKKIYEIYVEVLTETGNIWVQKRGHLNSLKKAEKIIDQLRKDDEYFKDDRVYKIVRKITIVSTEDMYIYSWG